MDDILVILFIAIVVVLALIGVVNYILERRGKAPLLSRRKVSGVPMDKNKQRPYLFEEYNEEWPSRFESIKNIVLGIFGDKALDIQHVGSTAVPGMKSKPVIDVLVLVRKMESFMHEKTAMHAVGYEWSDDYIAPGTLVFIKELSDGRKTENIHVCEDGSPNALRFIYKRDYLRAHPDKAREYAALKAKLKEEHPDDYPAYRLGKKVFLDSFEHEAFEEWKQAQKQQ